MAISGRCPVEEMQSEAKQAGSTAAINLPFSASDHPVTSACQSSLPKLPNRFPSHRWQS